MISRKEQRLISFIAKSQSYHIVMMVCRFKLSHASWLGTSPLEKENTLRTHHQKKIFKAKIQP